MDNGSVGNPVHLQSDQSMGCLIMDVSVTVEYILTNRAQLFKASLA